jgi:hypothetical protein
MLATEGQESALAAAIPAPAIAAVFRKFLRFIVPIVLLPPPAIDIELTP